VACVDGAAVSPVVAEVEDVAELCTMLDRLHHFGNLDVQRGGRQLTESRSRQVSTSLGIGDHSPVSQGEQRQMGQIPSSERAVDGPGQIGERVGRANGEHPPWVRPQLLSPAAQELHPDREPSARHEANTDTPLTSTVPP